MRGSKVLRNLVLLLTVSGVVIIAGSYMEARSAAIKYLQILDIVDEGSYQRLKQDKGFQNILTEQDREMIFGREKYTGTEFPRLHYKVNKINILEVKGYRHFVFEVNLTFNGVKTIDCLVEVDKGRIIDAKRKD